MENLASHKVEQLERSLNDAAFRLDQKILECENLEHQRNVLVEDRKHLYDMNMDHAEKIETLHKIYENKIRDLQSTYGEMIRKETSSRKDLDAANARFRQQR